MTSPLLRRAGAAAALTLSLTLAACGSDGSDGGDSAPSEDDLAGALLAAGDVPADFTQGEVDDDEGDSDIFDDTCLAEVSDFDDQVGSDPESEAKTEFTTPDAAAQAQITAGISVYDDADAVGDAFGKFYDSLDGCTNVAFTDENGIDYDIDVSIDDAVTLDGPDSQLTINLTGTVTAGADSLPVDFAFLVIRQGAATSNIGTSEVGDGFDVNEQIEDLAQKQSDKLADLLG